MTHEESLRTVNCPICGTTVAWSDKQPWRPFCSERCKLIDLGSWFDESNRIPDEGTPPSFSDLDR